MKSLLATGPGATSERGEETAVPDIRGITDRNGRLMVATFNVIAPPR